MILICFETMVHVSLTGTLFLFQKYTKDFPPAKDKILELPLWIKLLLHLCWWNENDISKVASVVRVPLVVDNLTASISCITLVKSMCRSGRILPLLIEISINLNDNKLKQSVIYDWIPQICKDCNSFAHDASKCPKNPKEILPTRGQSSSRKPRSTLQTLLDQDIPIPFLLLFLPLLPHLFLPLSPITLPLSWSMT